MTGSVSSTAPLWLGSIEADGFWLSEQWLGEAAARACLLQHWVVGADLFRSAEPAGWLLVWPQPRRLASADLPGLAVRRLGSGWSSSGRAMPTSRFALVWGDRPLQLELQVADASAWLDLGDCEVWQDAAIRVPVIQPPQEPARDLRKLLPGVPAASSELDNLLRGRRAGGDTGPSLLQRLKSWFQRGESKDSGRSVTPGGAAGARAAPGVSSRPGRLSRFGQALGRSVGLLRLFRLQHIAYLRRLLASLDRGDWDEALRHAIPLGDRDGDGGAAGGLLGLLRARSNFTFSSGRGAAGVGVDDRALAFMRDRYRQAFRALDAAGEVDKAVFVLAELLRDTDEALRYLAQHGRHRSAAELAELRGLPIGRQIALWLKAGDRDHALRLTVLHNGFADALVQLRDDADSSRQLRRLWAARLLASGALLSAIEVLWPVVEDRAEVTDWLRCARAQGLSLDARLLAREAALLPEHFDAIAATLQDWIAERSPAAGDRLRGFGYAITRPGPGVAATPVTQALARATLRALLCEHASVRPETALLSALQKHAADPYFNADRPKLPRGDAVANPALIHPIRLRHDTRGPLPIRALSPLQGGFCLLALGESGSVLIDPHGRTLRRFAPPATQLIGAPDSELRIAVMPRADGWLELGRIDLQLGRSSPWVELRLSAWSDQLHNGLWAVAQGNRAQLLDISGARPVAVWDSGELPSAVRRIGWDDQHLSLVLTDGQPPLQLWHYRSTGLTLLARNTLRLPDAVLAQTLGQRPPSVLSLVGAADGAEGLRLLRSVDEATPLQLWSGAPWPQIQNARLLQLPLGLLVIAALPDAPDAQQSGDSAALSLLLLSDACKPQLQIDIPTVVPLSIASDSQCVWVAAGGGLLRVEPATGDVRWLVP